MSADCVELPVGLLSLSAQSLPAASGTLPVVFVFAAYVLPW